MENILGPQLWPAQAAVEPVGRPVLRDIKSQGRIVSKVVLTAAGVTIPAPATVKEAETVKFRPETLSMLSLCIQVAYHLALGVLAAHS